MKKILTSLLSFFLLIVLFACSQVNTKRNALKQWVEAEGKIKVLATTPIVKSLIQQIGGEEIALISVMEGDLDPHAYEIVKGDGEKFAFADVVFATGLMLEHSASMHYQLTSHKNVVFLGDEVLAKYPGRIIYVDGQVDPHIWMDPSLWSLCIDPVVEKLSSLDPQKKEVFMANAEKTKRAFQEIDESLQKRFANIPSHKKYLVTSHDAFNYFVKRYFASPQEAENGEWQERMKALQGLAPDEQISSSEIQNIVDHIHKHKIGVIFPETNLSRDALEKVREAMQRKGISVRLADETLYGDTMGDKEYLEMIHSNAQVIAKYLGEEDEGAH